MNYNKFCIECIKKNNCAITDKSYKTITNPSDLREFSNFSRLIFTQPCPYSLEIIVKNEKTKRLCDYDNWEDFFVYYFIDNVEKKFEDKELWLLTENILATGDIVYCIVKNKKFFRILCKTNTFDKTVCVVDETIEHDVILY